MALWFYQNKAKPSKFPEYDWTPQICWQCLATKGLDEASLPLAFTNVNLDAPYWDTMFTTPPYVHRPSYSRLLGYSDKMISGDLLHIWHLGTGRDLAASALVYMLKKQLVFAGPSLDQRLAQATLQLKAWASANNMNLKLKKLTRSKLGMGSKKFPELRSNGYDTYIVLTWLETICEANQSSLPGDLCTAVWCANHVMSLLNNAGNYLSEEEQENKMYFGQLFLKSYVNLAHTALQERTCLYRMRPKMHLYAHCVRSNPPSRLNPNKFSTWMDEDALRHLMAVLRMTDARTAPARLLQRFLLSLPGIWDACAKK